MRYSTLSKTTWTHKIQVALAGSALSHNFEYLFAVLTDSHILIYLIVFISPKSVACLTLYPVSFSKGLASGIWAHIFFSKCFLESFDSLQVVP